MYESTNNLKKFSRDDRLTILAQTCIDNNITPNKGNFAGLIRKICLTYLGGSEATAKELTRSLTVIYRSDQWSSLLNPIDDEVPGESGLEPNRINLTILQQTIPNTPIPSNTYATNTTQDRSALHEILKQIAENSHPEPPKKVEAKMTDQQDRLTEKQIAQIFYNIARRDTFGGVGRIILIEAREIADDKHLQIDDVTAIWRRHYPLIDAEVRSNVILIYWDGKDSMRATRDLTKIIQPKMPTYKTNDKEGDVTDDIFDETVPEAKD